MKLKALFLTLTILFLAGIANSQVKINNIAVTTNTGSIVNPKPTINTDVGATVNLRNDGPAAAILTIHDIDSGNIVAEVSLPNPSNFNTIHGLDKGEYIIKIRESSKPIEEAKECGTLVVH
ncbi:MAG TPA: hypothetical protein ENK02_03180 [Planctomycetes bacterium]|nr:hypothetical protein [Planctomycetota bacterium]